MGRNSWKY